jgi:hypothetical protein
LADLGFSRNFKNNNTPFIPLIGPSSSITPATVFAFINYCMNPTV